jgi:hypothetical protein
MNKAIEKKNVFVLEVLQVSPLERTSIELDLDSHEAPARRQDIPPAQGVDSLSTLSKHQTADRAAEPAALPTAMQRRSWPTVAHLTSWATL